MFNKDYKPGTRHCRAEGTWHWSSLPRFQDPSNITDVGGDKSKATVWEADGPKVKDNASVWADAKVKSDGGSTGYYRLPEHATELRHLISHKGMSKARGDIFKACYRLGEKDGTDVLYDLKKMKFFIEDLIEMHERGESL